MVLRKAALCAALLLTLAAGKCENTPADVIKQVQDQAVKVCGFLPVASTVGAIIDALGGGGSASVVLTAANGICAAVKPKVNALASSKPEFMGVPIEGSFVEKK